MEGEGGGGSGKDEVICFLSGGEAKPGVEWLGVGGVGEWVGEVWSVL